MIRRMIEFSLTIMLAASVSGTSELEYRQRLCDGLRQEVTLANGARADCISTTHAIEVDFSEKWAEALGQSLLYAAATDLTPGIYLICRQSPSNCLAHRLRLEEAIRSIADANLH